MAGSEAKERVRMKAEAAMRIRWPEARIVHELVLEQGGCRIDIAAVGPDFLAVAEIKSERDVLKRLPAQLQRATQVADEVWVCIAAKHAEAFRGRLLPHYISGPPQPRKPPLTGLWCAHEANPDRIPELDQCRIHVEEGGGLFMWPDGAWGAERRIVDPRARFDLLWAAEMVAALRPLAAPTAPRNYLTRWAVENLTGAQIRRAVCEQIRSRPFPRADAAIERSPPSRAPDLYRGAA